MYKRFGLSLAKATKYEVNIIGIESKNLPTDHSNILFHTLPNSGRSLKSRLKNSLQYIRYIRKIQPHILIITSPGLLLISSLLIKKRRMKWVYDIQEDYYKNIIYQRIYPVAIRHILATLIRLTESICLKRIDTVFLAEKCYQKELNSLTKRIDTYTLENKSTTLSNKKIRTKTNFLRLVFTGTISHYAGIKNAVKIYQALKANGNNTSLTIVGICHTKQLRDELRNLSTADSNIQVIGINNFVEHNELIGYLQKADLAIIGYETNEINKEKAPSKLYEYLTHGIPFIVQKDSYWHTISNNAGLAIPVNFSSISAPDILEMLDALPKTPTEAVQVAAEWSTEEATLQHSINQLAE
ncbi:MAG: glycosyltransferase involved in cell wall biosynthesis [Cyclobacteriaceae bacterium]|jgi:glycogen(starch) synthase